MEVLMGMRAAGHRFMPNRLVFPGGRVDLADRTAPAATELRPDTRAALERRAPPRRRAPWRSPPRANWRRRRGCAWAGRCRRWTGCTISAAP
ncbi:NUDIX hydrolase [Teichococcus aestuarii]|uniref:hypothetical protein n=1 Tax=Teichococcus aestuarii TaxID=568898 RepID=UPI00361467F5